MHQWELLLSWGSTLHVFSTIVKDFPQCREKSNPKSSILSSHFCWSIIPCGGVCVWTLFTNCRSIEIWALVKQVRGIYWFPMIVLVSLCWRCCVKKSGLICCSKKHWINVFKLYAAVHLEQVVEVGIFSPFAEVQILLRRSEVVAGEDM